MKALNHKQKLLTLGLLLAVAGSTSWNPFHTHYEQVNLSELAGSPPGTTKTPSAIDPSLTGSTVVSPEDKQKQEALAAELRKTQADVDAVAKAKIEDQKIHAELNTSAHEHEVLLKDIDVDGKRIGEVATRVDDKGNIRVAYVKSTLEGQTFHPLGDHTLCLDADCYRDTNQDFRGANFTSRTDAEQYIADIVASIKKTSDVAKPEERHLVRAEQEKEKEEKGEDCGHISDASRYAECVIHNLDLLSSNKEAKKLDELYNGQSDQSDGIEAALKGKNSKIKLSVNVETAIRKLQSTLKTTKKAAAAEKIKELSARLSSALDGVVSKYVLDIESGDLQRDLKGLVDHAELVAEARPKIDELDKLDKENKAQGDRLNRDIQQAMNCFHDGYSSQEDCNARVSEAVIARSEFVTKAHEEAGEKLASLRDDLEDSIKSAESSNELGNLSILTDLQHDETAFMGYYASGGAFDRSFASDPRSLMAGGMNQQQLGMAGGSRVAVRGNGSNNFQTNGFNGFNNGINGGFNNGGFNNGQNNTFLQYPNFNNQPSVFNPNGGMQNNQTSQLSSMFAQSMPSRIAYFNSQVAASANRSPIYNSTAPFASSQFTSGVQTPQMQQQSNVQQTGYQPNFSTTGFSNTGNTGFSNTGFQQTSLQNTGGVPTMLRQTGTRIN